MKPNQCNADKLGGETGLVEAKGLMGEQVAAARVKHKGKRKRRLFFSVLAWSIQRQALLTTGVFWRMVSGPRV